MAVSGSENFASLAAETGLPMRMLTVAFVR